MKGLTVKALVADCVVAGKTREIRFAAAEDRGDLVIKGLTYDEAMSVLAAAVHASGDEVKDVPQVAPPQLVTPPEAKQHPDRSTVALVDAAAGEDAAPALAAVAAQPEPETTPEVAHEPEPEPAPTNGKGNGEQDALIAKLLGHKRILHIVNVLVENGFKTSDEVLAKCQEVRAHVPALERITPSDFDERIRRVYEVLDAGAVA